MKKKARFKKETHFGGSLQNVNVSQIKADERKLTSEYDKGSIRFALHHLKVGHRISPPVIEKLGPKQYRVVDGSHRLVALKRFGIKKIRAEVV